jgi:hypothetical protein
MNFQKQNVRCRLVLQTIAAGVGGALGTGPYRKTNLKLGHAPTTGKFTILGSRAWSTAQNATRNESLTELLVVTACLYGKGCNETYSQYYQTKPSLQHFVMKTEREIQNLVGRHFITYVVPPLAFMTGSAGTTKLTSNLNIQYSRTFAELIFKKDF